LHLGPSLTSFFLLTNNYSLH